MRSAIFLLSIMVIPVVGFSATINIPADYLTIQQGIDRAVNGDTVLVSPGTYLENIVFKGKAITVKGKTGHSDTIIDGGNPVNPYAGSVVTFCNSEGSDSVLDGFTITNGTGTCNIHSYMGGGIYCGNSSPLIINNLITHNQAGWGGGICCFENKSMPLITNCSIIENTGYVSTGISRGGGILCFESSAHIKDCLIMGNTVQMDGGGIAAHGKCSPIIENNIFDSNTAEYQGGSFGGGFQSTNAVTALIKQNTFTNNRAGGGGAIAIFDGTISYNIIMYNKGDSGSSTNTYGYAGGILASPTIAKIDHNIIAYNTALTFGGGMVLNAYQGSISNNTIYQNSASGGTYPGLPKQGGGVYVELHTKKPTFSNCMIYDNHADDHGGGIFCRKGTGSSLLNCTVCLNTSAAGGAIYCEGDAAMTITNSIIYASTPSVIFYGSAAPTITYSNVKNGYPGTGNINQLPLMVDPLNGDLHLQYFSPCRDTGNSGVSGLPSEDFEGDPRIVFNKVDMGADEFHTHLYYTGTPTPGSNVEIKIIGVTFTQPVDLWFGAGVLANPVKTAYGDWHLKSPLIGPVSLGFIPYSGARVISGTIPLSPPGPYTLFMQALVGPELTNLCVMEVE